MKKINIFKKIRHRREEAEDLGRWVVPTTWEAITLKQYQEIERLHEAGEIDVRDLLAVLCNKTRDEVYNLPLSFLEAMTGHLSFMREAPVIGSPSNEVTVNGERYFVNVFEKLRTGEYVSSDNILRSDKHNYAAVLAIMCRKEGEAYDPKFEAEKFEDRMRMFEQVPITELLPIVTFFLTLWAARQKSSRLSTEVEEAGRYIALNTGGSGLTGLYRRLCMNLRMRRLRRLNGSLRDTSRTS